MAMGELNGKIWAKSASPLPGWLQFDPVTRSFGGLKAGQVVMLGSVTPPIWLDRPCHVSVAFEGLGEATVTSFPDGESFVKINENIRGADVFVVQPTNPPGENMLELLLLIDAALIVAALTTLISLAVASARVTASCSASGPWYQTNTGQWYRYTP